MTAPLPAGFTVHQAMIVAGVNDTELSNGQSSAARLAEDIFDNAFSTCMDKTHTDVEVDFKSFSGLTLLQGQIRILPRVKNASKCSFNGQGMRSG